jgi:hypothetical protein
MSSSNGGKISPAKRQNLFKRWIVVYKHDGSPLEGALFVHKAAADKYRARQTNADKLEVRQFNLTEI